MSILHGMDKVERELFRKSSGKELFTVSNTILLGSKGANDVYLDSIYNRSYDSKKYSDMSQLQTLNIRTSDYITFNYNNFEEKVNSSIFISYPNLGDLVDFLEETYKFFTDSKVFDKKGNVTMNYQEAMVQSEPLGGDKVLLSIPTSLDYDGNYLKGVCIFLNDEDIYVELDERGFFTIYSILASIDLLSCSNQTIIMSMLGLGTIGGGSEEVSISHGIKKAPKSPLKGRKVSFGTRPSRKASKVEEDAEIEEVDDDDLDFDNEEDEVVETKKKATKKKPAVKKTATKKKKKTSGGTMSFENLMDEADNIEFDDEDLDEDLDLDDEE